MDFAVLPPEVNSARMYAGPGSGPMLAAAMAWDELAAALQSTANSYQAEITALTSGPWVGPSSASMIAAITPYLAWMRTTGAQAEETANQARTAAFAYETAFAETVPPPVVTANRTLLATLVATNVLGQNTPAIATTEAEYAEMWARDTAAMFGYAGSTAAATRLTPFAPPDQTTTSDAGQSEAVAQATGTAAGSTRNTVQQSFSAVPNLLTNAVNPAAAADPAGVDALGLGADLITYFLDAPAAVAGLTIDSPAASIALPFDIAGALTGFHTDDIVSGWAGVQSWPGTGAVPPSPFPVITNPAGGFGSVMSAGLGQANTVGGLSVPPGWASAAPAIRPAALVLPATSAGAGAEAAAAAAAAAPSGSGSLFGEMAVASMAGRAMAGTGGALGRERARAGEIEKATREAPKEPTKEPATPPQVAAGGPITSIAAELRELASLRDAGILTQQEFEEQKKRLLPS